MRTTRESFRVREKKTGLLGVHQLDWVRSLQLSTNPPNLELQYQTAGKNPCQEAKNRKMWDEIFSKRPYLVLRMPSAPARRLR